jgi:ATP-dependent RNA helicase DHX29
MDASDHMIEEGSRYAVRENRHGEKASLYVTSRGGEKRKEVVDLVSQTDVGDVSAMYPGYKMSTRRSMDRVNEEVINYDLIEDILNLLLCRPENNSTLLAPDGADLSTGSVLVFLPGLGEIRSMTERLEANRSLGDSRRFEIIPMHSTLSSKDQRRVFVPAKHGCRKIILSTNIAETSVTIPDVICVLDSGRVREVRRNKRTSTSILVTDWCSKASAKQRAGRAGRVQPGLCLKLYSSRTGQIVMKPASEPELRRVPLEEVCLQILASDFATSCMDFLCQAPQPPSEESVEAAVNVLIEVGAIEVLEEKSSSKRKAVERLTPLGQHLAKLPVDVRLGKMLIHGALFRCMDKVLTIAAGLSSQSPFSTFVIDANVAKAKQRAFADPDSDFLTICNVWESYCGAAATSVSAGRKFCQSNYLNYVALREIGDARRQFLDLLCSIGFLDRKAVIKNNSRVDSKALHSSTFNENGENPDLVHAVICAGLYPNVAHLEQPTSGEYTMFHKDERLHFHNSSVNSKKKRFSDGWVVFHEKFGTPHRVSVSTTCFVHPFALLLLGGSVVVKHTERLVIVDDWIEIGMAAQIGVIMRELRKQVDVLMQKMIENAKSSETETMCANMIQGIVNLLAA